MYTLRRMLVENQVQSNVLIGESYNYVDREIAYEEFKKVFEKFFYEPYTGDSDPTSDDDNKNVYGFIIYDDGSKIQPLYKNQRAYVMTESGQTFSNLTYRP